MTTLPDWIASLPSGGQLVATEAYRAGATIEQATAAGMERAAWFERVVAEVDAVIAEMKRDTGRA